MWVRLLGAICVIGAGAAMGCLMGHRLRERQDNLALGKRSVEFLLAGIRSSGASLPEVLMRSGNELSGDYGRAFSAIAADLLAYGGEPVSVIWERNARRHLEGGSLKEQDIRQFGAIGEQLGLADRKLQETIMERYLSYASGELEMLRGEVSEKCRLYRNLGILFGIFVTLLLL